MLVDPHRGSGAPMDQSGEAAATKMFPFPAGVFGERPL